MLFRKNMEKRCSYCARSVPAEAGVVLCAKLGLCKETDQCGYFQYDPLKRIPPRPASPNFERFQDEDFQL